MSFDHVCKFCYSVNKKPTLVMQDSKSPMCTVCHKRWQPQVVYINNGKSSLIRSRPELPSDSSGYKLCRNMGDRKVCPRGPTCSFAHSEAELKYWFYAKVKSEPRRRQPAAGGAMFHYSSKLQMCNSVVAEPYGYCRHGTNCIFPHSKEELDLWQEQRNYLSPPLDNIGPKPVLATPSALCYMESRSNGYEYGDVHAHSKEELKAWNQTSTSNDCSDDVTQVSEVQQLETKSVDCDSSRGLEDDVDVFACNSDNSLSEDTCIEQYKKALRENAYVTVGIVKAMTIGPPRVGKTCLRSLLLGQVPPKNSPSTSVLKTAETVSIQDPAQKTIVSHCISTSGWEVVDTTSGIISLLKYLQEGKHNSHGNSETSHSEKRPRYPSGSEGKSPGDDLSQTPDTTNKVAMQSLDSESLIPVEGRDGPLTPDQKLFAEQIYQVISQSSEQPGVKLLDANLLQFLDTGGQISYHDILPVFITTPAIYFHVFNIMKDLDKRPKDCIQLEDDEQDSVTSPLTTLEMISRSAITVHSLANKNIQLPCFVNDKYYPKPKMVIVGTHMDELLRSNKDPEEELKKNSKKLDSALSGLKFSIIKQKFDDKEQMFHPVNNYMYESNPDTIDRQQKETIERLRKEIERIAADMKFQIPVPWYLQQLLLTKENDTKPFYKYSDLLDLCKNNGVVRSNSEFYAMISLFHNLGLVVHHDVGEEPKDEASHGDFSECLVFTNPSFLYENISRLYAVQFETCHGWKLSLKDQGLLQASVLPEIKVDESLTPEWFMDLLVTLFIGAEVTNCRKFKERTLFVPSVLLPNTQPSVPTNNVKLALMFEISSAFASHRGETYIPCGIFTGTIARLQSRDDWQVSRYGRISRTSITFQVGNDGTYVKLSDCTQYITFEILTYEVSEERCQKLRDVVFDDILESYKYLFEKDAQSVLVIGLPCSKTDHQNHIAPLTTTAEYSRFCVKCPYTRQTVTIDPSTHQVRSAEKELEDKELSIFLRIFHPAVKKEFHTPAQKKSVKKAVSEESCSGATTPTGSSQAKTLSKPCAASQKQVASSPSESWKDEKPTEIQLRKHVCKHITGNYQEVCTYLGIPHTKIKGIRQDNQTSPLEQTVFECLLVWHSGNSEKYRPCWKVLLKAIKDAEHGDLVTDLTDKLDKGELDD